MLKDNCNCIKNDPFCKDVIFPIIVLYSLQMQIYLKNLAYRFKYFPTLEIFIISEKGMKFPTAIGEGKLIKPYTKYR